MMPTILSLFLSLLDLTYPYLHLSISFIVVVTVSFSPFLLESVSWWGRKVQRERGKENLGTPGAKLSIGLYLTTLRS